MVPRMVFEIAILSENQIIPQESQLKDCLKIFQKISLLFGYFIVKKTTREEFQVLHIVIKAMGAEESQHPDTI